MTTLQVKPIQINEYLGMYYVPGLEKEMATHSSVLAWRTPGTAELGGLPSMGSHSRTQLKRLSSSIYVVRVPKEVELSSNSEN